MTILKRLTDVWVNEKVGFFFLSENLAERGDKTRLGAGMEMVGGRRKGMWTKVITRMKDWVVAVGFDNGRYRCWGRHTRRWCGLDWGRRHRAGEGACRG